MGKFSRIKWEKGRMGETPTLFFSNIDHTLRHMGSPISCGRMWTKLKLQSKISLLNPDIPSSSCRLAAVIRQHNVWTVRPVTFSLDLRC